MKKVEIKSIIRGILVLVFFTYSFLLQYIPVYLFHIDVSLLKGNYVLAVLFSTFSSLIILLVLLLIYHKDLVKEFKVFRKNPLNKINDGFTYWIIGLMVMYASNIILSLLFHTGGANNEKAVQSLISAYPILMGLDVCILAPFNEELVFRKTLYDVFHNQKVFIILSFLLFGYVHVSSMASSFVDWLYIIPYGALGASFAATYSKTNTVFASMFLHMIHNTLLFFLSVFI